MTPPSAQERAALAEVIRAAYELHEDGDGYFPAADQVLVWMRPIIADALAQAVQAAIRTEQQKTLKRINACINQDTDAETMEAFNKWIDELRAVLRARPAEPTGERGMGCTGYTKWEGPHPT